MFGRNLKFAGLLALAVAFSAIAWTSNADGRAPWIGLATVFLVLAITTRRRGKLRSTTSLLD